MDLNELKASVIAADDAETAEEHSKGVTKWEVVTGELVDVEDDDEDDDIESSLSNAVVILEDLKILLLCLSSPRTINELHKFTGLEVTRLLGEVTGFLEEQGVGEEFNIEGETFNVYD